MKKAETKFVERLRSKGETWQKVGTFFGMHDEACRSAYRRAKRKEIADNLQKDKRSWLNSAVVLFLRKCLVRGLLILGKRMNAR